MLNESAGTYFGLIVAYLLPGFVMLAGLAPLFPPLARWLEPMSQLDAGAGPPVYTLLAAVTLGMILSCIRWVSIDQLHRLSGVKPPAWEDGRLESSLEAFDYLVRNHFRYYEFCSNTLVALILVYGPNRLARTVPFLGVGTDLGVVILSAVLFAASRDALVKYYRRTTRLLGQVAEKGDSAMYNGNDHTSGDGKHVPSHPATAPQDKPVAPATPQSAPVKNVPAQK